MNIRILFVLLISSVLLTVMVTDGVPPFVRIAAILIWLGMVLCSDPLVRWMSKR